jgi:hypothetical protein
MKCPKCNEEALFVNGKYVCVDCGIEITPEEQANQFSSNDLLDANPSVAASNPITDPDPQVSRSFNTPTSDDQNQPLSTPDPAASTVVPPVDEPTIPEPAPAPVSEQANVINEPVISEPIQAAVPEPTVPEAEPVLAEPSVPELVEMPTPDPVEPIMASTITPVSDTPALPVTDQVVPTPSFNQAEVKKPVEDYYKSELENTEKPQEDTTSGSGIYDFTTDQNIENNQVAASPEALEAPQVQEQVVTPDVNPTPDFQAEIPIQSPVSPVDPVQPVTDFPVDPVPLAVDPSPVFNTEEPQISEPVSESPPVVNPLIETPPVVPETPEESVEANVQAEPQVDELVGLETHPEESSPNAPIDINQVPDEPVTPPIPPTLAADGFTIPVQTEEPVATASESLEPSPDPALEEPVIEDIIKSEPEGGSSPQDQPYFQPSTFEMSTNNEDSGLTPELPTAEPGTESFGVKNEEPNIDSNLNQDTNFNNSTIPESTDVPVQDSMTPTPVSTVDELSDQPVQDPEIPIDTEAADNLSDPQESPKSLNDLLNQSGQEHQANPEAQVDSEMQSSLNDQASDSDSVGFSVADIKKEGPMPTVESVFGNGGDGDAPMPQDYGLPAPKPPNEKKKKMILIGSLVGGLLLIGIIVLMVFLSQPKNPYPIVLGAEAITTLSSNVTNIMDEKQDIAVKYEVTANYENLEIKNPDPEEPGSQSMSYSASGDWLSDKAGNIHVLSSVNGANNKQTYMAARSSTFVFDENNSKWEKNEGNKITSIPSYISPNSRSSAVYAQNIQSITLAGVEQVAGASTRVYEIKPSKSYIESINFLGSDFSSLSYVSLDSSNLNVKVWVGANDNKIYKLELSGNLIIESEEFSGEIGLTTTASYEYRSVLISNPEETAKESPPELITTGYIFKKEDGKPSSVNEDLII